jgi:hypothetical protein
VSAASINRNHDVKPIMPAGVDEIGDIGAFVFTIKITEASTIPIIEFITDATVICEDINGEIHEMVYVEYSPDRFFYVAYDVPAGQCEITASKQGYDSNSVTGQVVPDEILIYRIELDENPVHNRFITRLLDFLPNFFLILRLFLRL